MSFSSNFCSSCFFFFFWAIEIQLLQQYLLERPYYIPLNCFGNFVKNKLAILIWTFFSILCSIVPQSPNNFDQQHYIINIQGVVIPPILFLFVKMVLGVNIFHLNCQIYVRRGFNSSVFILLMFSGFLVIFLILVICVFILCQSFQMFVSFIDLFILNDFLFH